MKISLHWLREWVDTGDDVPALAHALTMAGIEIEGMHKVAPPLSGIVVGEVLAADKHPDADKLRVCRVSSGTAELQIVCGAPNVRVGMKAPLALIGARLPSGVEIKAAKLRGVDSSGMLCSAKELGLNLSEILETGLTAAIAVAERERWQAENEEAIDAYNRHVESHGVWSDGLRRF